MAAVDDAIASLLTRVVAQYLTNGGYVTLFPQDMASVALIAQYAAQQASAAGSSATLAAGSLAAAQAITGGTQGIGSEPLDLRGSLSTAARRSPRSTASAGCSRC